VAAPARRLAVFVRRAGVRPRPAAAGLFGAVFLASLAYSIATTASRQEFAYFDTGARLWEFALGSLVAIAAPHVRIGRAWSAVLGVLGLAGLVSCGFVFDVGAGFPGYIALWPTLSAAALILAGQSDRPGAVSRALGAGVVSGTGRFAYALYLVHWPILIGFLWLSGRESAGLFGGAGVVALSVFAAVALHLAVEQPLRRHRDVRAQVLVIVAAALAVALPLAAWQTTERVCAQMVVTSENPGALVLMPEFEIEVPRDAARAPLATTLDQEWVSLPAPCSGEYAPTAAALVAGCGQSEVADAGAPVVLVLGDSHAEQWMGAAIPLAEANGWQMVSLLKGGCPVAPGELAGADEECVEWQREAVAYGERLRPDVVMLMGTKTVAESDVERVPRGLDEVVDRFTAVGSEVVLLRDNPRFDADIFRCVEALGPEAPDCARESSAVLADRNPADELGAAHVHVVDLTDFLCPDGVCVPVIGNVSVYLDHNHLTASYARTLALPLREALQEVAAFGEIAAPDIDIPG